MCKLFDINVLLCSLNVAMIIYGEEFFIIIVTLILRAPRL
jgi:hypothetical protein